MGAMAQLNASQRRAWPLYVLGATLFVALVLFIWNQAAAINDRAEYRRATDELDRRMNTPPRRSYGVAPN